QFVGGDPLVGEFVAPGDGRILLAANCAVLAQLDPAPTSSSLALDPVHQLIPVRLLPMSGLRHTHSVTKQHTPTGSAHVPDRADRLILQRCLHWRSVRL